jgi:hypothetical protein
MNKIYTNYFYPSYMVLKKMALIEKEFFSPLLESVHIIGLTGTKILSMLLQRIVVITICVLDNLPTNHILQTNHIKTNT